MFASICMRNKTIGIPAPMKKERLASLLIQEARKHIPLMAMCRKYITTLIRTNLPLSSNPGFSSNFGDKTVCSD